MPKSALGLEVRYGSGAGDRLDLAHAGAERQPVARDRKLAAERAMAWATTGGQNSDLAAIAGTGANRTSAGTFGSVAKIYIRQRRGAGALAYGLHTSRRA